MSFDVLLTIVFILFFVIGPLLKRISGGSGGSGDQSGPSSRPRQPGSDKPGGAQPGSEQSGRGQPGRGGLSGSGQPAATRQQGGHGDQAEREESPLARRLEEARRRVEEAMSEAGARHPERPLPAEPRPAPPVHELDWQAQAKVVPAFLPSRVRRTARPVPKPESAKRALRAERSALGQTAKLRLRRRPALDENGILDGMIWHEILSEPVSRRGTRRQPSRLRSR